MSTCSKNFGWYCGSSKFRHLSDLFWHQNWLKDEKNPFKLDTRLITISLRAHPASSITVHILSNYPAQRYFESQPGKVMASRHAKRIALQYYRRRGKIQGQVAGPESANVPGGYPPDRIGVMKCTRAMTLNSDKCLYQGLVRTTRSRSSLNVDVDVAIVSRDDNGCGSKPARHVNMMPKAKALIPPTNSGSNWDPVRVIEADCEDFGKLLDSKCSNGNNETCNRRQMWSRWVPSNSLVRLAQRFR